MRAAGALRYLIAPLPAIAVGVGVMRASGVPVAVWGQNVAAFVLGLVLCFAMARARAPGGTEGKLYAGGGLALAFVAATLLDPGTEGVHRWVKLGPVRLHAGAVVFPLLLVVVADLERAGKRGAATLLAMGGVLVAFVQPDAAQCTAFAAGVIIVVLASERRRWSRAVALAVLAGASWFRADTLLEVPHVEGIVGLATGLGAGWAVAATASLLLLPAPFLAARTDIASRALGAYVATTLVAAVLGSFPFPVLGYGAAPIIGYLTACGLLLRSAGRARIADTAAS